MNNSQYVWYACYGSNLCCDRFMDYINKCRDTKAPLESRIYEIKHELYFTGESKKWKGAVAFINPKRDENAHTLGRIYYITDEQYEDVKVQEGCKYLNKIELGEIDGVNVVTFTDFEIYPKKEPSQKYLECIAKGIKDTYPKLTKDEIEKYLSVRTEKIVRLTEIL